MSAWIGGIIERFGGRPPGSPAEAAAQAWLAEEWGAWCDAVTTQPFMAALNAKFHALKWFCLAFYLCLALYWVNLPAATLLAALNAVLLLGHFVAYRDWLDPFNRHSHVAPPNGSMSCQRQESLLRQTPRPAQG